jgi:hypothetical protein
VLPPFRRKSRLFVVETSAATSLQLIALGVQRTAARTRLRPQSASYSRLSKSNFAIQDWAEVHYRNNRITVSGCCQVAVE